jgi:DNA-binding NtrC family response regulator
MRIAWIEDEPQLVTLLRKCLSRYPFSIQIFTSGAEFFEEFELRDGPFLLVTDRVLKDAPGGEEICRTVKNSGLQSYIVLTSGYPESCIDRSSCIEFLPKPWTCKNVHDLIARAIEWEFGLPKSDS